MHNTRIEKRTPISVKVEYWFEPLDCPKKGSGPWKTFTSDISYSGMGLYSDCPAEEGQVVQILLRHVFTDPVLAEVRWCRKDEGDLYRMGVRFL